MSVQFPNLIDYEGLARLLGVSVPTVKRWKADGEIPFLKIRGCVRFDPVAVINARTITPRRIKVV